MNAVYGFLAANIPSWKLLLAAGPVALGWSLSCLWFAGRCKRAGMRTGYTRKIFHFLIFSSVAMLQWRFGSQAVCLFGSMCSLVVFYAVWRGPGNMLYEAMARENDAPHRTFFILVPYFTTLVGGLASSILFGPVALAGFLVAGVGDAIGEPIGTRFGRHKYRVPSLASVPAHRSWEGSAAVFIASCAAVALTLALSPGLGAQSGISWRVALVGLLSAAAEAVSPHGWDNATMQVLPAWLTSLWIIAP
jgi:phytol kinase